MRRLRSFPSPLSEAASAPTALTSEILRRDETLPAPGCADCATCAVREMTVYAPTLAHAPEKLGMLRQRRRQFGPHQIIVRHNDRVDLVYTLQTGWAYRVVQFPDGRRQILSFLLPGDTIATEAISLANYALPYSVRALTHVTVCGFHPSELREVLFSSTRQREHFARYMLEQRAFAERRITDIGRRRAIGSLAHLLVELFGALSARGLAHGDVVDFPPRQEDLADALGLTTAHVNRTLLALRRRGLALVHAGRLHVHDLAGLRDIAEGN